MATVKQALEAYAALLAALRTLADEMPASMKTELDAVKRAIDALE